jgi:hypothetical protein
MQQTRKFQAGNPIRETGNKICNDHQPTTRSGMGQADNKTCNDENRRQDLN